MSLSDGAPLPHPQADLSNNGGNHDNKQDHTRPAPLACLECRDRHLKCDGVRPVCGRCTASNAGCHFTPSRRGRKRAVRHVKGGPQRAASLSMSNGDPVDPSNITALDLDSVPYQTHSLSSIPVNAIGSELTYADPAGTDPRVAPGGSTANPVPASPESLESLTDDGRLVNLFYVNFHLAHPILLPRRMYGDSKYAPCLRAVVEAIGSHFSSAIAEHYRTTLWARAVDQIESAGPDSVDLVQACLLMAITQFARDDVQTGAKTLSLAISAAVRLGMHTRDFAITYGKSCAITQESLRRTWYELFITESYAAALQRKLTLETTTIQADVLLPSDEDAYEQATIPPCPPSWADFEDQIFADTDTVFSSFTYRIKAAHILGQVVSITGPQGVHRDEVQLVDNALASWSLHLPPSKAETEIINTYGRFDIIMFQAHVMISYATMLLHFPRGSLRSPTLNAPNLPDGQGIITKAFCPCNRENVHSVKAVEASKHLTMLAALRSPASIHSPFYVYPLALGALVQLAVCTTHLRGSDTCLRQHRARVILILGLLKSLSQHWPTAGTVHRALGRTASAVLNSPGGGGGDDHVGNAPANGEEQQHEADALAAAASVWLDGIDFFDLQEVSGLDPNALCL
ncbi:hypothetical protein SLS64_013483 [Diaporthe eres]|uniref:Zn(2)-C6 fungal-type domain-containing protein n=1 Tax=Diaporthe eres TaxID=83184 RepID=A0ABR1NQU6_DIAER